MCLYVWPDKKFRPWKVGREYMKWSFSDSKAVFTLGRYSQPE